ncbi:MAG: hypothetical protein UU56_C0014G0036 [Candidatus Curtissbacteria bacterium GW2011_GWA2_41_24]|uniref:Uncharacterized protein n=1 Tax=Candidatus Curtissbacteria bacterium GW2011_GWA2_41_24 TaxID=1618411 RepID=A0A0G0VW03_9BACT|nr:MAG: hypothetical protein UU56_C0014G0036 [Candidatus Curtissbacteria bacterium GW2011_GWA2_41_24]
MKTFIFRDFTIKNLICFSQTFRKLIGELRLFLEKTGVFCGKNSPIF